MELEMLLSVGTMIKNYGVPGMLKMLREWDILDPTEEDVNNLYNKVSKPSEQFENTDSKFDW